MEECLAAASLCYNNQHKYTHKGRRFVMESRFDWTNLLIGILMIIVGILVLTNPAATMTTLAIW